MDELTSGGVRTTVPADALKAFCQRCRSLNLTAVVAALKKRMTDDVWQTQLVRAGAQASVGSEPDLTVQCSQCMIHFCAPSVRWLWQRRC